jgi:hypothetical protein
MVKLNTNFKRAVDDLLYLLERDYPKRSSIDIVGNRYRLGSDERMMLFRGVFKYSECRERMKKRVDPKETRIARCVIDGYNVFITLESFLSGRTVFRSLDGWVRDISGVYGNYTFGPGTIRAAGFILDFIKNRVEPGLCIYLDYPVSKSGEFALFLRDRLAGEDLVGRVEVVKSPDVRIVKEHRADTIATSDTVLIDKTEASVDIPSYLICDHMGIKIVDMLELMVGQG